MRLVIKEKNKFRINRLIDWLLHMVGYTISFIIVTSLFKSIIISDNILLWSTSIVLVLYIFNKTIKPILVTLTIPITGLTLGLFYPCINVFILKLADWCFGSHFEIKNILVAVVFALLLSVVNFINDEIIKKIINKVKANEKGTI